MIEKPLEKELESGAKPREQRGFDIRRDGLYFAVAVLWVLVLVFDGSAIRYASRKLLVACDGAQ